MVVARLLTHGAARVGNVGAGDGLALVPDRLVVGLTHDEADELSDRLLHGHLGIVCDLRMPVAAELPGHDLCDISNGKESILLADSLVGLPKYISRCRLLCRWSCMVALVAAARLTPCLTQRAALVP